MRNRNKKVINTLSVLSKQRAMELEMAKADVVRANKILLDAEVNLEKVKSEVDGIEATVRDTVNNQAGFSVQELIMRREYLAAKRIDLSSARNGYDMAIKAKDEISEHFKNKNQQLELVNRMKDNKVKKHRVAIDKQVSASNDELCTQNKRT